MNPLNVGLGIAAALIYAFLGYSAQDKPFSWRKFLRTVAIGTPKDIDLTCFIRNLTALNDGSLRVYARQFPN
jgi:hypothetical protein